jgi:nucleoid DNA-binding protein
MKQCDDRNYVGKTILAQELSSALGIPTTMANESIRVLLDRITAHIVNGDIVRLDGVLSIGWTKNNHGGGQHLRTTLHKQLLQYNGGTRKRNAKLSETMKCG